MKESKGSTVFSVILTILVVGMAGYIIYDKVAAPKIIPEPTGNADSEALRCTECPEVKYTKGNIQNFYSNGDTEEVHAQKIAEGVVKAINDKDYYFLAKLVGDTADYALDVYDVTISKNKKYECTDFNVYSYVMKYKSKDVSSLNPNTDVGLFVEVPKGKNPSVGIFSMYDEYADGSYGCH